MLDATITGKIFSTLQGLIFSYGKLIFESTAEIFLTLFLLIYSCQFLWKIFQTTLLNKKFNIEDFLKPMAITTILPVILSSSSYCEEWIVRPVYDLSVYLATLTAAKTSSFNPSTGIVGMLNLVDGRLNDVVFQHVWGIYHSQGLGLNIAVGVGVVIIWTFYFFLWALFLALMVDAIWRFMTFFAISPLLIISLLLPQTKSIGLSGFKSLLQGLLGMFMVGLAMGMTLAVLSTEGISIVDIRGDVAKEWIFSESYFSLILVSLISISFHLKAPKVAANLSGIDDGAGAAATVAALGTGAMMAGKAAAMKTAAAPLNHLKKKGGKAYDAFWDLTKAGKNDQLYGKMTGK